MAIIFSYWHANSENHPKTQLKCASECTKFGQTTHKWCTNECTKHINKTITYQSVEAVFVYFQYVRSIVFCNEIEAQSDEKWRHGHIDARTVAKIARWGGKEHVVARVSTRSYETVHISVEGQRSVYQRLTGRGFGCTELHEADKGHEGGRFSPSNCPRKKPSRCHFDQLKEAGSGAGRLKHRWPYS